MTNTAPNPSDDHADILNVLRATDRLMHARLIVAGIRMAVADLDDDEARAPLCQLADMAIDGMIEVRDQLDEYRLAHQAGGAA